MSALMACLRRWYVFVPVLVLGSLLAWQTYDTYPETWRSSTAVVVLAPTPDSEEVFDNTYLTTGGARFMATVLADNLESTNTRAQIAARGGTAAYTTSVDRYFSIVEVEVVGTSAEQVVATADAVVAEAAPLTEEIQREAAAAEGSYFVAARAVPTNEPTLERPGRSRNVAVLVLGSAALAGVLSLAVDAALNARRRRRRGREEPAMETDFDNDSNDFFEGLESRSPTTATLSDGEAAGSRTRRSVLSRDGR
ncbi:hypothetical protein [Aquipuribacter nitratireducens]|uniref:Capsular polysaccharide biosynthesis protein n=1 Tax=Aquipuribacter nitratireducens TaxID=650104 RepID=A0ABW0GPK1_9MICO